MDCRDVFVPEQTDTAVSWKLVSSFAANKFKAPPSLISTWEFRVDLASQVSAGARRAAKKGAAIQ